MYRYVVISLFLVTHIRCARSMPPGLRVTIDCSDEKISYHPWNSRSRLLKGIGHGGNTFDVNQFCSLIHSALPKAVKNGRFVLIEPDEDQDQTGAGNAFAPVSIPPPKTLLTQVGIPRFKQSKLKIPKISVPTLYTKDMSPSAPRLSPAIDIPSPWYSNEQESSMEKLEIFKKGVQKMLHFVKVLGKIDQYLTERTRIIIEKLSKTFTD